MSGGNPAVLARGVGYRYPSGRTGLEPTELSVRFGEIVVVLGPNGSGKSTLLRLLATDLRPSTGSLTLLGRSVRGGLARVRRRIGYAPDTAVHFGVLSGLENAERFHKMVPRPGTGPGAERPEADPLPELFRAFDLWEVRELPVSEYSYGMRRKLLLVQSLCFAPRLALLDEPSVGLDPRAVSALRDTVVARRDAGGSVVIASNEIREVPMWADRVLFLLRGRVVENAPLPALLARLKGHTRIEVDLSKAGLGPWFEQLGTIPGVGRVSRTPGGVLVESSLGPGPLPALLKVLLSAKCRVSDVRVRSPDLGDLFHSITGERLVAREGVRCEGEGSG